MNIFLSRFLALIAGISLLTLPACVAPSRTDFSPDDEVDDSGGVSLPPLGDGNGSSNNGGSSTGSSGDVAVEGDDDDDDDQDTTPETADCGPIDAETMPQAEILDCNGDCSPASLFGNGECDEEFNCEELFFDAQECE